MPDTVTQRKWDKAATTFDFMNGGGPEKRWAPRKRELFSHMRGEILFLAVGTGLDIQFFPPGQNLTGIDISPAMLKRAAPRVAAYPGSMTVMQRDVLELDFADQQFDQVYTSCTFCSVPTPVAGLQQLWRVLKPGGELRMFEHTGSRYAPFRQILNWMTPLSQRVGPELNRDTVANVEAAGFEIVRVCNVYLDIVKTIHARRAAAGSPASATPAARRDAASTRRE